MSRGAAADGSDGERAGRHALVVVAGVDDGTMAAARRLADLLADPRVGGFRTAGLEFGSWAEGDVPGDAGGRRHTLVVHLCLGSPARILAAEARLAALSRSPWRRALVVIDGQGAPEFARRAVTTVAAEACVVIAAAAAAPRAALTRAFADVLESGEADADCDGWISAEHLYEALARRSEKTKPLIWRTPAAHRILVARSLARPVMVLPALRGLLLKRVDAGEDDEAALGIAAGSTDGTFAARAKLRLGRLHDRRGALDEAVRWYAAVLDSGVPNLQPRAALLLARAEERRGRYGAAEELYRRALGLGTARAAYYLGAMQAARGRDGEAVAAWEQALALGDPEVAGRAAVALGRLHEHRRAFADAARAYARAADGPYGAEASQRLETLRRSGRIPRAEKAGA